MYDTTVHPKIGGQPGRPIGPVPFFHKGSLQLEWMKALRDKVKERNQELPDDQCIELAFEHGYHSSYARQRVSVEEVMEQLEQQRLSLFEAAVASPGTTK